MRNRTGISWGSALALGLTILTAAAVTAGPRVGRGRSAERPRPQSFDVSGQFTGALSGTLVLDGNAYRLSPGAFFYEIGTGSIPEGTVIANRQVFMAGVMQGQTGVIHMVIVRPADELRPERGGSEGKVGELPADAPR